MQRLEIFKLMNAVDEIIGTPQIKETLSAKQIYAIAKLKRKLRSENERTAKRQDDIRISFTEAMKQPMQDEEKNDLQKRFSEDWKAIIEEEVDCPVEVKLPFDAAETILKSLTKSDSTEAVIEYLIEEPKE